MNVLSLFDGISGARLALERSGLPVTNYYASEIDKWAIQIAQKNYPSTIQLGDVTAVKAADLPPIDLLVGGSPCQGFSYAGKGLNFDDPRSALFFEFVRLLKEVRPKWFLLENVRMKKEWQDVISEHLGVQPILINSALVSAQNRQRLYWTNIPNVGQPKDKGLVLADIVEHGMVDRVKSYAIDANYYKGNNLRGYFEKRRRQLVFLYGYEQGRRLDDGKSLSRNYYMGYRVYDSNGLAGALTGQPKGGIGGYTGLYRIGDVARILLPIECERLQTFEDGHTEGVSNTQRYKALGNSFTVDVIAHILRHIPR